MQKHEISATSHAPSISQNNAQNAINRKQVEEMARALEQKDHEIRQLQQSKAGRTQEKNASQKRLEELRNEVAGLNEELRRERARTDIQAKNKQIMRLQKEREQQDVTVKKLSTAIDMFKDKMLKYESETVAVEEKSEA